MHKTFQTSSQWYESNPIYCVELIETPLLTKKKKKELIPNEEKSITLLFEKETKENNDEPIKWSLLAEGIAERKKIVSTLAKLWKDMFKLDLMIIDQGSFHLF